MVWNRFKDIKPSPGDKIVALYNDGSGSEIFWFSCEGGEAYTGERVEELEYIYFAYDRWAYLPPDFLFFGEDPLDEMPSENFMLATG